MSNISKGILRSHISEQNLQTKWDSSRNGRHV